MQLFTYRYSLDRAGNMVDWVQVLFLLDTVLFDGLVLQMNNVRVSFTCSVFLFEWMRAFVFNLNQTVCLNGVRFALVMNSGCLS